MIDWFDTAPRRILALVAATCVAMLAFGMDPKGVMAELTGRRGGWRSGCREPDRRETQDDWQGNRADD